MERIREVRGREGRGKGREEQPYQHFSPPLRALVIREKMF